MAKLSSELRTRIKQGRNTVSGRRRFCVEETSGLNRTSDGARAWEGAARRVRPWKRAGWRGRLPAAGFPFRREPRRGSGEGKGVVVRPDPVEFGNWVCLLFSDWALPARRPRLVGLPREEALASPTASLRLAQIHGNAVLQKKFALAYMCGTSN
jgi:hypothetical protein